MKRFTAGALLLSAILFGGCSLVAKPANVQTENPIKNITGVVTVAGTSISIKSSDGKITEITSRKIDLTQYAGKTVTMTGEFSGTTLFVDSVK